MNQVTDTIVCARTEAGAVIAQIVVTREANGVAIWFDPIAGAPGLLEWHAFSPRRDPTGVYTAAKLAARRMATEAIDHGLDFVANRRIVQR